MSYDFTTLIAAIDAKAQSIAGTSTDAKDLVFLGKAIEAIENATGLKSANNLSDLNNPTAARANLGLPLTIVNPQADHTLVFDAALQAFVSTLPSRELKYLTRDPEATDVQFVVGDVVVNTSTGRFWVCVSTSTVVTRPRQFISTNGDTVGIPQGQQLFINENWTPTTSSYAVFNTTFTVPDDVYSLSAVLVGGGGGGSPTWANGGGAGGALAWANSIPVTPGETLSLQIGNGGAPTANGGNTVLLRGSTTLFAAQGGRYNNAGVANIATPVAGAITPGNIDSGRGGLCSNNGYGGGGGAGGYTGNGGNGSYGTTNNTANTFNPNSANGTGGAGGGGGGYESSTYSFGGGGGVGVWGAGTSGIGIQTNSSNSFLNGGQYGGGGGSAGENGADNPNGSQTRAGTWGTYNSTTKTFDSIPTTSAGATGSRVMYHGQGGSFGGGGGGGGSSATGTSYFSVGGMGGARIIWGMGRSFPATKTGNVTSVA